MAAGDSGGEMDPHGADLRGNPLGGLVYSTAYTGNFEQVIEWHNFMGSNMFCFKACDPSGANAANYCQHIYDRIGCAYNAPSNVQPGMFQSCLGDSQDFPGVYTNAQGQVVTYTQPAESLGPITSMPYTPKVPASSDCTNYNSAALFAGSVSPGSGSSAGVGSTVAATTASTTAATSAASNPSNSSPTATSTSGSSTLTATSQSTTITPAPSPSSATILPSTSSVAQSTRTNAAFKLRGTSPLVPLILCLFIGLAGFW
ncbi:hypothetical protein H0H92_003793 [Tricholoma furcatifolium]|nr:hypothetical protein H0H92_003793 [Tricholoma furcatifolium]